MVFSIVGVAVLGHLTLGLSPALALLLGAVLAPTDPVLASDVAVREAADRDHMRYGLSGEAGLNDGMAFPFVVLALGWHEAGLSGPLLASWFVREVLWAVPVALLFGFFAARAVGRLAIRFRSRHHESNTPSDFFSLAVVALTYVAAESLGSWGFLAVFAAGVGLRHAELHVVGQTPHPVARESGTPSPNKSDEAAEEAPGGSAGESAEHPPAEDLVGGKDHQETEREPAVAAGVLVQEVISFGDSAERLLEVMLVVVIGVSIALYWDWRALPVALALLFILRPLVTQVALVRTPTTRAQRWLMGWFGIRGIGSLYYLTYAMNHGLQGPAARTLSSVVITVVAVSIAVHGVSSRPLLNAYERRLAASRGDNPRGEPGGQLPEAP